MDKKTQLRWVEAVGGCSSVEELTLLVDAWMAAVRNSDLGGSLGFEFYMTAKQWDNAKGSLIRSFGRNSEKHGHLLEFLTAVVDQKRMLKR
jgi:hypothetical protein